MNHNEVDNLLKNTLRCAETLEPELKEKIRALARNEAESMKHPRITRPLRVALIAAIITISLCATALAAALLLRPGEVADTLGDNGLAAAFESEGALNIGQTQTSGTHTFTLMGIVSGKTLSDYPSYANGNLLTDRSYVVLAIQNTDGSPMPSVADEDYGKFELYVTPLIKGCAPWRVNSHTMNGNYSEMVVDGVMYRLLECDDLAMFADRGVYIGVCEGVVPNNKSFAFDEATGEIKAASGNGTSVVFDLPLDIAKADPVKAEVYLKEVLGE